MSNTTIDLRTRVHNADDDRMGRLEAVCMERGITLISVSYLSNDYVKIIHAIKTIYVEKNAPEEAI